jgi:hypothetical protein
MRADEVPDWDARQGEHRVGDHIVMFTAASAVTSMRSVFNEDEFVRLANAANERVRARL